MFFLLLSLSLPNLSVAIMSGVESSYDTVYIIYSYLHDVVQKSMNRCIEWQQYSPTRANAQLMTCYAYAACAAEQ